MMEERFHSLFIGACSFFLRIGRKAPHKCLPFREPRASSVVQPIPTFRFLLAARAATIDSLSDVRDSKGRGWEDYFYRLLRPFSASNKAARRWDRGTFPSFPVRWCSPSVVSARIGSPTGREASDAHVDYVRRRFHRDRFVRSSRTVRNKIAGRIPRTSALEHGILLREEQTSSARVARAPDLSFRGSNIDVTCRGSSFNAAESSAVIGIGSRSGE